MKGPTVGIIAALFANAGCERGAQVATLQLAVDSLRAAIDSSDTRISSIEYDQILGSGWTYQRARLYDPQTGRFSQTDPIGIAGGMNGYGFAGRDPINFSDPFGLCPPADNITGPHCNVIVKGLFPNVSTGANRIGCTAARLGKTVASWREVARSEIDVIGAVFDFFTGGGGSVDPKPPEPRREDAPPPPGEHAPPPPPSPPGEGGVVVTRTPDGGVVVRPAPTPSPAPPPSEGALSRSSQGGCQGAFD